MRSAFMGMSMTAGQWCVMVPEHTEARALPLPMRPRLSSLVHCCRLLGAEAGDPLGPTRDTHS